MTGTIDGIDPLPPPILFASGFEDPNR